MMHASSASSAARRSFCNLRACNPTQLGQTAGTPEKNEGVPPCSRRQQSLFRPVRCEVNTHKDVVDSQPPVVHTAAPPTTAPS
jgi:hypothetical protein